MFSKILWNPAGERTINKKACKHSFHGIGGFWSDFLLFSTIFVGFCLPAILWVVSAVVSSIQRNGPTTSTETAFLSQGPVRFPGTIPWIAYVYLFLFCPEKSTPIVWEVAGTSCPFWSGVPGIAASQMLVIPHRGKASQRIATESMQIARAFASHQKLKQSAKPSCP